MPRTSLHTRSELPWILGLLAVVLVGWYAYNVANGLYREDPSEGGAYHVITYGSDPNPARIEQKNIFDRYHRQDGLKLELMAGGSNPRTIPTKAAAGESPDIIDVYPPEEMRLYAQKGIARPINEHLKRLRDEKGIDIREWTWEARLDDLRLPNPDYVEGESDPLDRWLWYGVPNNINVRMVWYNRSLYERARSERGEEAMPPEPWLHWTWWDYAALAKAMHRRGSAGNFISFGGSRPPHELIYHQIGLSMRGLDREAFAALSAEERRALGLDPDLSWEECTAAYHRRPDGSYAFYPNREALQRAMQFCYDLDHTLEAVPSATDSNQMANVGGFGGTGGHGQFKSGTLGMFLEGRWFLGQVRADATFDWRLYRIPRWVPYEEWARWQREAKGPGERDGPWGDADPRTALRGYGNFLGGRMSFISGTAVDQGRDDEAFAFLEYLLTNPDFNRILLIEDGMGADRRLAMDYLSEPDPLFPDEAVKRPVEHELGALERLIGEPAWPWNNYRSGRRTVNSDLGTWMNKPDLVANAAAGDEADPVAYDAYQRWYEGVELRSDARAGALLADKFLGDLAAAADDGQQVSEADAGPQWPNLAVWLALMAVTGFFALFAWLSARARRPEAAHG